MLPKSQDEGSFRPRREAESFELFRPKIKELRAEVLANGERDVTVPDPLDSTSRDP